LPMALEDASGESRFNKGSIPRAVAMPSHSPHASRLPPSEPPYGGHPCCLCLAAVGGARPRRGLAPFSHRSASRIFIMHPGYIPSPMVIQDDDHQFGGGEKQARLQPLPCPQLQGSSSSSWGGGRSKSRPASVWVGDPLLPPAFGGERHPPALRRRRPLVMRGKANCCFLDRVQLSVLHPGDDRAASRAGYVQVPLRRRLHNTSYAARAVLVFWDDPVLVLVARMGVRTCRCALGRPPLAGAVLVVARGGFADETVGATRGQTSGSLALMACPRPSSGDVGEGLLTAAFVLRSSLLLFSRPRRRSLSLLVQWSPASHLEFVVPQAIWCGCCSYPREWNQSPVCNGTQNMGVCSLWLSRPEHLGI
jgi:hypothetical protein